MCRSVLPAMPLPCSQCSSALRWPWLTLIHAGERSFSGTWSARNTPSDLQPRHAFPLRAAPNENAMRRSLLSSGGPAPVNNKANSAASVSINTLPRKRRRAVIHTANNAPSSDAPVQLQRSPMQPATALRLMGPANPPPRPRRRRAIRTGDHKPADAADDCGRRNHPE